MGLVRMIKGINRNFRPAACSDINCLQGELAHLQSEVVDQKKNLEIRTEELKSSNRKFESFAHVVAHDIKAPLRSIMSCLLYTSPSPRDKRQSRMPSSA